MAAPSSPPVTIDAARSAKAAVKQQLARVPGLVGVGVTRRDGGYAVKVNLDHALAPGAVPSQVNGVPLVVEVVGSITKR